jgi:plasmid rolling circle replication initiator protein Rep
MNNLKSNCKDSIQKQASKVNKKKQTEISTIFHYKRYFLDTLSNKYLELAKQENNAEFQNWATKVYNCFNYFQAGIYTNGIQKIFKAQTCQDRLCPACGHRRSLRTYAKLIKIAKNEQMKKYRYLHIVLTVKNCMPDSLTDTINKLFYSFKKFTLNKRIKKMNLGYFRSLEITYNEIDHNFHPHLHILICVNSSYFSDPDKYLKHKDIMDLWQKSALLNYSPDVWIKALKKDNYEGFAEIAKYAVKESEQIIKNIPLQNLKILRLNLSNRRLISLGGIIKKMAEELKLNLANDSELTDNISDIDIKDETLRFMVEFLYQRSLKKLKAVKKELVNF